MRRAAVAVVSGLLLVYVAKSPRPPLGQPSPAYVELGHALLTASHPRRVDPSFRLPMGPLLEHALLASKRDGIKNGFIIAHLLIALLTGAAGALLAGPAAGALASLLALLVGAMTPTPDGFFKMLFFTPLVLLPALALALRARRPGAASDWLAGLAFAAGFLYRSTLFFLPFLLAGWELARGRDRRTAQSAARLLLPCVLAVLPWMWMNGRLHGHWTPFERGASDMLVVGGVLGMVDTTPEGDRRALAPDAPEGPGVLRWAAGRVAADPLAYAAASLRRLLYAFGLLPWLVLLAAAGLWRARRDPSARALGLFAGYFFAVHAFLATLPYYYEPVWPVLCALCAGLLTLPGDKPERFARASLLVVLIPCLAFATSVAAAVARYGALASRADPASHEALALALSARPDDARLRLRRAQLALAQGRVADARADARAVTPVPAIDQAATVFQARLAEALGERGAAARTARLPRVGASEWNDARLDLWLIAAVAAAQRGERAASAEALTQAAALWHAAQRLTEVRTQRERAWERQLRAGADESLGRRAAATFEDYAPQDWAPAFADSALLAAPTAARAPSLLLQESGRLDLACPRLERLAMRAPSARAEVDAGVCAYLAGRKAQAAAAFRRALKLEPGSQQAAASLRAASAP